MTRCGNWGLQKSTQPQQTKLKHDKANKPNNNKQTHKQQQKQPGFMTRFAASKIQNSTS
jgi:hypothetical protein